MRSNGSVASIAFFQRYTIFFTWEEWPDPSFEREMGFAS
jgi:hypothetical protein